MESSRNNAIILAVGYLDDDELAKRCLMNPSFSYKLCNSDVWKEKIISKFGLSSRQIEEKKDDRTYWEYYLYLSNNPLLLDNNNNNNNNNNRTLTMPQLAFGTAHFTHGRDKENLTAALELGYRHIDGADTYGSLSTQYIREVLAESTIPRNQIWITWKATHISEAHIRKIILTLKAKYIDLLLVYGCDISSQHAILLELQLLGLIRYYGITNCDNPEEIIKSKQQYNIYSSQENAKMALSNPDNNMIQQINKVALPIMFYSVAASLIEKLDDNVQLFPFVSKVVPYFIQTYIRHSSNVIIVGSQSGSTLKLNYDNFNTIMNGHDIIDQSDMGIMRLLLSDE